MSDTSAALVKRIVGHADVDPTTLTAHPDNWRKHPAKQRRALEAALDEIGVVQNVIVNTRTGRIVDGHLRVEIAVDRKEPTIPVVYVDLDDELEAKALATFDATGALASIDGDALSSLVSGVNFASDDLRDVLMSIAGTDDGVDHDDQVDNDDHELDEGYDADIDEIESAYAILVTCDDEQQQRALLTRFADEGIRCRALIS